MTKVIGLTGSIAVGKSTVTDYLVTHGYQVLDADQISKEALSIGTSAYCKVVEEFGCVLDNQEIDRKALGNIVFHDLNKKKQLEDVIHPYVIEQLKKGINECQDKLIFLDVPLLYEVHLDKICDKVMVVYVDEKTQLDRLMNRNHISSVDALNIMHQQISIEKKKEMGDYMIDNRYGYQELYENIERVLKEIKNEIIHE